MNKFAAVSNNVMEDRPYVVLVCLLSIMTIVFVGFVG